MRVKNIVIFIFLFLSAQQMKIIGYGLPLINLGGSSFLDGGPLRQIPGYYFQFISQDYHAHDYKGPKGHSLCDNNCPDFNVWLITYQLIYLSTQDVLGLGNFGWDATLPVTFYSRIEDNILNFRSAGAGVGDLALGVYAQALPTYRNGRPVYVHRFEFVASFPTGKDNRPIQGLSPGNGVFYMDPYWAGTAYFTPEFSASWRLHYLWVSEHHTTHFKAGDAIHANFALEYALRSRFYLGINGYYLEQIKDHKLFGQSIPNSRERALGIGGGFLYALKRRLSAVIIGNLYFETLVRNRAQGIKFVFRYYSHF